MSSVRGCLVQCHRPPNPNIHCPNQSPYLREAYNWHSQVQMKGVQGGTRHGHAGVIVIVIVHIFEDMCKVVVIVHAVMVVHVVFISDVEFSGLGQGAGRHWRKRCARTCRGNHESVADHTRASGSVTSKGVTDGGKMCSKHGVPKRDIRRSPDEPRC
jgi:hypothetical protein